MIMLLDDEVFQHDAVMAVPSAAPEYGRKMPGAQDDLAYDETAATIRRHVAGSEEATIQLRTDVLSGNALAAAAGVIGTSASQSTACQTRGMTPGTRLTCQKRAGVAHRRTQGPVRALVCGPSPAIRHVRSPALTAAPVPHARTGRSYPPSSTNLALEWCPGEHNA
jgi:hypothetical protein